MERRWPFLLASAFFGLTSKAAPQVRLNLFNQIHQILFHGKGGYDYYTVYNMPIWLRKYTFSQIKEWYDKENKSKENNQTQKGNQTLVGSDGKINRAEFMKASKPYKGKTSYK